MRNATTNIDPGRRQCSTLQRAWGLALALVLCTAAVARADISAAERQALFDLYNATNGGGWVSNTNWLDDPGTECYWRGVACDDEKTKVMALSLNLNNLAGHLPASLADLIHLRTIDVSQNQLSGPIPSGLGNAAGLIGVNLYENQFSGPIPPQLAALMSLRHLHLQSNQLSGPIPPQLGSLTQLGSLRLNDNRLDGPIPPEIGNLTGLEYLYLNNNRLEGSIPPEIGNLVNLQWLNLASNRLRGEIPYDIIDLEPFFGGGADLGFNALYSNNGHVRGWLSYYCFNCVETQTVAPENVIVTETGDTSLWLSWDPVTYNAEPGGYEVFVSLAGSGEWFSVGWTDSKNVTTFPAPGLDSATSYELAVVSFTEAHPSNQNTVFSDAGEVVVTTTGSGGCAAPSITVAWGSPVVLTVPGVFTSYLWSTGETTPSIEVEPDVTSWHWVTVTGQGGCEESATVLVDESLPLFADGFESGDLSGW